MTQSNVKKGLGKGLNALIPSVELEKDGKGFSAPKPADNQKKDIIGKIKISSITRNPYQPRTHFEKEALEELKSSINEHGVIQPITVRKAPHGYELISGERRFRASKELGLDEIPAYILDINDSVGMLELAMIENLHRQDLNPIETAFGYQRLIEECSLTQEQVAQKMGKDRSTITNFLRLLRLPEKIHESIRNKEISMGHARALLAVSDEELCSVLWKTVVEKDFSVRMTEKIAKEIEAGKWILSKDKKSLIAKTESKSNPITEKVKIILNDTEDKLRHILGADVRIKCQNEDRGSIAIEYYSKEDLNRLLDLFNTISNA
jgi:ParB family chromosome partitioning protein